MIFSKVPEVDEEDLPRLHHDGRNSNGDSAGSNISDEGLPLTLNAGASGVFDFESVLNLGPHFDKLVGVFKDIALLPDSSHAVEGNGNNDYEEYV